MDLLTIVVVGGILLFLISFVKETGILYAGLTLLGLYGCFKVMVWSSKFDSVLISALIGFAYAIFLIFAVYSWVVPNDCKDIESEEEGSES